MLNQTKTARKRRFSRFLAKPQPATGFSFLKENQGSLTCHKMENGNYMAVFSSKVTQRKAHSYGKTFGGAYQNMIRLFNIKYSKL